MIRLIRFSAKGLGLFSENVEMDFFAEQRVFSDNNEMLTNIFSKFYVNNVISIVGINASGKTTFLRLFALITDIINGTPINLSPNRDVMTGSQKIDIEVFGYDGSENVFKLMTTIVRNEDEDGERYVITAEKLYQKPIEKVRTKKDLLTFDGTCHLRERSVSEDFLQDDASIVSLISRNDKILVRNLIRYTDRNMLRYSGNYPGELIRFLDPSIESLTVDMMTSEIELKFYNKEPINLRDFSALSKYLSSGTVKGLMVFLASMRAFQKGGYVVVDEIENHFNREIVATLVRFFMNPRVNKAGATLIFSTHYSELLDEFERSDNIFIVRNRGGISLQKLCAVLKRNDIKKSEAFKSGFLDGTVPQYETYIELKELMMEYAKEG